MTTTSNPDLSTISAPVDSITPANDGSATGKSEEDETDRISNESWCDDYSHYIREDFHNRVFVDFEVFAKSVLHVPSGWKTLWGRAIETVKENKNFKESLTAYREECDKCDWRKKPFLEPLMNAVNTILDVISAPEFDSISRSSQYHHLNGPMHMRGGVTDWFGLSPDLHKDRKPSAHRDLHPVHILEVSPYDGAICDGMGIPKLVVDGKPMTRPFIVWQ